MRDYWNLTRPRIVALVLAAMFVAAWTAAETDSPLPWVKLIHALLGAALAIAGAITLNQRLECRGDAKMPRTAGRPLPAGHLTKRQVTFFGVIVTAVGLAYLAALTNALLTLLTAVGWLIYVAAYTPLKTRTAWQTPVGALAGAMPTLLGAAAVDRPLGPLALVLFATVYFWQFPHSTAIAWLYRREFAAAGVKLATVTDPTGRAAGWLAVAGAGALLPVSLIPGTFLPANPAYVAIAGVLGLGYLGLAVHFALRSDDDAARRLLRASLAYLPALLVALLAWRQ